MIGIVYKKKEGDTKKRIYTILLQKLAHHPNPEEAARQLYQEHPHFLHEKLIPVVQITQLIKKIQAYANTEDFDEEPFNARGKQMPKGKNYQFDDDDFDDDDDHPHLNNSR